MLYNTHWDLQGQRKYFPYITFLISLVHVLCCSPGRLACVCKCVKRSVCKAQCVLTQRSVPLVSVYSSETQCVCLSLQLCDKNTLGNSRDATLNTVKGTMHPHAPVTRLC